MHQTWSAVQNLRAAAESLVLSFVAFIVLMIVWRMAPDVLHAITLI